MELELSRRIRSKREANQLLVLTDQLNIFHFSSSCDMWLWKGEASIPFSVKELCNLISTSSDVNIPKFEWVKWIPLKVKCFVRILIRNCIPLSSNFLSHGVCVASTLCSFCSLDEECLDHVFFPCNVASSLWNWLVEWSGILDKCSSSCLELLEMLNLVVGCKKRKQSASFFKSDRRVCMPLADDISIHTFNSIKIGPIIICFIGHFGVCLPCQTFCCNVA